MDTTSINAIAAAVPRANEGLEQAITAASGLTGFVAALEDAGTSASEPAPAYYNPAAGTPGTPQYDALASPDAAYIPAGIGQGGESLPGFTPTSARAWWTAWFASPYDLRLVDPAALPGSLVLTEAQAAQAIALSKTTLPAPPASAPPNPNLYQGSTTLSIIQREIAAGNPSYPAFAQGVTFGPRPTAGSDDTTATVRASGATAQVQAPVATMAATRGKAKSPTAAQLASIKARAVAAGHRPTHAQVLATYYRHS